MEKVAPNSKFVGHSTEIIRQSKIKGPLLRTRYVVIFPLNKSNWLKRKKYFILQNSQFWLVVTCSAGFGSKLKPWSDLVVYPCFSYIQSIEKRMFYPIVNVHHYFNFDLKHDIIQVFFHFFMSLTTHFWSREIRTILTFCFWLLHLHLHHPH